MSEPLLVGYDPDEERNLYVLEVGAGEALEEFRSPAERFGCLLVANATRLSDDTIRGMGRTLLNAGAGYFVTWGLDCERVHDLIDAERPREEPGENDVVMTTWLVDVALDEAIWQSVYVAFPAGRYAEGCSALVAVVVDDPAAAAQIRRRYGDLRALCADVEFDRDGG